MSIRVWSAVLAVALAALAGTISGQVKPGVKALTPMDYIEIRQLVNRFAFALDTGSNNGYDYADLFAADGESMRPYAKGREQLAALARGPRLGPDNTVHYIRRVILRHDNFQLFCLPRGRFAEVSAAVSFQKRACRSLS